MTGKSTGLEVGVVYLLHVIIWCPPKVRWMFAATMWTPFIYHSTSRRVLDRWKLWVNTPWLSKFTASLWYAYRWVFRALCRMTQPSWRTCQSSSVDLLSFRLTLWWCPSGRVHKNYQQNSCNTVEKGSMVKGRIYKNFLQIHGHLALEDRELSKSSSSSPSISIHFFTEAALFRNGVM